ncbi:MAG: GIY-YIG nuclease family protein [Patescibacteria group bacterium]
MFYVYVLKNANQRLYVGRTKDLKTRIQQHVDGKNWTTRRMGSIELICYEAFRAESDAIRRERYFKTSKGKSSLKQIIRDSLK